MAILGSDLQVSPQDLFTTSLTAQAPLGAKTTTPDGRVYRYAQFDGNANITQGNLLQAPPRVANHQGIAPTANVLAGATSLTVTLGGSVGTAAYYTNGFLVVDSGAGTHVGYTYGISNNTGAASSGTIVVFLTEPLQSSLITTDSVCLVPNPYRGVIASPTTLSNVPAGVAVTNGSAAYFGWIQTRGPAAVLADSSVTTIGQTVAASSTTAGTVTVAGTSTAYIVGDSITATVSAKNRPVFLTIE